MLIRNPIGEAKDMGILQQAFDAELGRLPNAILEDLISEKLEKAGISPDPDLLARIADHVDSGSEELLEWDGEGPDVKVALDSKDFETLSAKVGQLVETIPAAFDAVMRESARAILKEYKTGLRDVLLMNAVAFEDFRQGIDARWGGALDRLKMLHELSREAGEAFYKRHRRSKSPKRQNLGQALSSLHLRACQVTAEIILLLENGYPDGAMARWRTLHEIAVTAAVLDEGGEEVARRYLGHQAIEAKRAVDQYQKDHIALGEKSLSPTVLRRITLGFDAAIAEFGPSFKNPYGWAVGYVDGGTDPKFPHLAAKADQAALHSYYKLASYNVHASPRGLEQRIGTIDDPGLLIAGATNAGLEEPASRAAATLVQLTSLFFRSNWKLDELVQIQILIDLRDETLRSLSRAANKLRRDEIECETKRARRRRARHSVS
jgi:hypothetical protein